MTVLLLRRLWALISECNRDVPGSAAKWVSALPGQVMRRIILTQAFAYTFLFNIFNADSFADRSAPYSLPSITRFLLRCLFIFRHNNLSAMFLFRPPSLSKNLATTCCLNSPAIVSNEVNSFLISALAAAQNHINLKNVDFVNVLQPIPFEIANYSAAGGIRR